MTGETQSLIELASLWGAPFALAIGLVVTGLLRIRIDLGKRIDGDK